MGSRRNRFASFGDAALVAAAKIGSRDEYKDIDVAVVKATNHDMVPPKEKHVRTIVNFTNHSTHLNIKCVLDCILKRTKGQDDWLMVLKSIMVIHRMFREVKTAELQKRIAHYSRHEIGMLKNYKDNTSSETWDTSAFIRTYSQYLHEKFEAFIALEFDTTKEDARESSKTRQMSTPDLCDKFPKLQNVMYRVLGCKPVNTAKYNNAVLSAFLMVITESFKLYRAINDGVLNALDKFFETDIVVSQQLFNIYKVSLQHASDLQDVYTFSKSLAFGSTIDFPTLETPPESFQETMQDYIKELKGGAAEGAGSRVRRSPAGAAKDAAAAAAPQFDTTVDLLDFSAPEPAPPSAAPPVNAGFEAFESNMNFGEALPPPAASAAATGETTAAGAGAGAPAFAEGEGGMGGEADRARTSSAADINLDALYSQSTTPGGMSAAPQNPMLFGGIQPMAAQGSPFGSQPMSPPPNGLGQMSAGMQGMQGMQSMAFGMAQSVMGMGMQSPMAAQQQPQGGMPAAGNPFASGMPQMAQPMMGSPQVPSMANGAFQQAPNFFSPQQQAPKPEQGQQQPTFDFLS